MYCMSTATCNSDTCNTNFCILYFVRKVESFIPVNSILYSFPFRLKKKSQSIEISASGYEPLPSAAQHALQPTKPTVLNNTTSEEEQKNTANSQRRHPRKGELKRYYTIGKCTNDDLHQKYLMAFHCGMISRIFIHLLDGH